MTACGNRRETVCPACSQVYKRDARQLVRAGLTGGKGIPETVAAHPCVFATLTAPSFGPVHARRKRGKTVLPCRPRRDAQARRCPHGRDISCPHRHADDDPRLGRPMCPRLLRLHRRRAVQRPRRGAVAPVHHLPAPPPRPPRRPHPRPAPRRVRDPVRQGRRIPGPRRRPLPRHHPPRRARRHLPAAPPGSSPPRCCATPSRQAAAAVSHHHRAPDPAVPRSRCGSAGRPTPGPSGTDPTCPAPARRCPSGPSPTTSPSTPPRPSTRPASPTIRSAPGSTSTTCAAPATTRR